MKPRTYRFQWAGLIVVILLVAACNPKPAAITQTVITTSTAQPTKLPPTKLQPTNTLSPTEPLQTPVVIDTGMSVDGIMAILYILQRPELNVKAITVAGSGEVHCGPGVEHALGLVALVKAAEIPVACGRETPLVGDHQFPAEFRATADSSLRINWPDIGAGSKLNAVELLEKTIRNASKPVLLMTDGPLTNVAEALMAEPQLVKNIEMIYIMGGAIDVPGNLYGVPLTAPNTTAEFNIYIDPHAANVVLDSGAPITLVPLDATNQVPLDTVFFKILSEHQTTLAAKAVYDMLDYTGSYLFPGNYFWDSVTYAIASDESLATFTTKKITVVEDEGPEIGRTKVSLTGNEVRVALTVDAERFYEMYLSTLNGGQKIVVDWVSARAMPTPPPVILTVVIQGGKCTLEGSKQVPAGLIGVNLIDKDPTKDAGLAIVTLDAGKTFADVDAYPSTSPPSWMQVLGFNETTPGNEILQTVVVEDKPVYLVCFDRPPDAKAEKIGALGPIEAIK